MAVQKDSPYKMTFVIIYVPCRLDSAETHYVLLGISPPLVLFMTTAIEQQMSLIMEEYHDHDLDHQTCKYFVYILCALS